MTATTIIARALMIANIYENPEMHPACFPDRLTPAFLERFEEAVWELEASLEDENTERKETLQSMISQIQQDSVYG